MTDSAATSDAALKPLLQMCKDCEPSNISTIRTLILKALTHPEIFSGFDEIKQAVQPALSSAPDGESLLRTLDLFSYGCYKDYTAGGFVSLTDTQLYKLKMLTIVTLVERACCVAQQPGVVPYATVAEELTLTPPQSLESLREVEELVIACIYSGIVNGKLCQKSKTLIVSSQDGPPCRSRDVPPQQVSSMLETLKGLQKRLESTMATMETNKKDVDLRRKASVEILKNAKEAKTNQKAKAATSIGWPSGGSSRTRGLTQRSTASARRQGKRSRGGPGGVMGDPHARF